MSKDRAIEEERFWDRHAPRYDALMHHFTSLYDEILRLIEEELRPDGY